MTLNLARLNPNQREAVLHPSGPLLVLAGAGSGKTSTMTYRIAHLISVRGQSAASILGLSFTNKAAGELKERVTQLVTQTAGSIAARGLTISTFHSLCVRLLRGHAEKIGFRPGFTIIDQNDQRDILKQIFKNTNIDDRKFDHDVILGEMGQAKSRFLSREAAETFFLESGRLSSHYGIAAASAFGRYQDQLRALNAMDFDDLLYYGVKLLEDHGDVRAHYNERFRNILVDEYQDTNPAQFRILRLLTETSENLCVVGDDDQSIYSWRGADASHILQFSHHFPKARTIILDQNYRSTTSILDAANQVIKNNKQRHAKKLWSDRGVGEPLSEVILEEDRDESEWVAEDLSRRAREHNKPWKDFAVLYRSNAQSRLFEEALRRHRVPYKIVGGMSFLDRKEVKNVLSYWRLIANLGDEASLRRILNWPARGIGKSSIELLGDHAFKSGKPLFEALADAGTVSPRAQASATAFREMILDLRLQLETHEMNAVQLADWGKASIERIGAKKAVEEDEEDPVLFARKWENVEELVHSLGQTDTEEKPSALILLQEYLDRMTLDPRDEEEEEDDQEKNQVTLLTLHGAKGLEFPVVYLVGMEEGFLPHRRTLAEGTDLSEERRLCYVGITRAKDHLCLTRVKNRIRYGKPVPRYRSRFLEEIPSNLLLTQNRALPDASSPVEERKAHEDKVKDHLAQIRALIQKK